MRTTLARFCCWCIAGTAGTHVNLRAGFLRRPPPWGRTQGVGFYHFEALRPPQSRCLERRAFLERLIRGEVFFWHLRTNSSTASGAVHAPSHENASACVCVCVREREREQFIEEGNEDTRRKVSQQGSGTDIGTRKNKQSVHRKRREHTQRKQRGSITAKWT